MKNKKFISLGFKGKHHTKKTKQRLSQICRKIALQKNYGKWMIGKKHKKSTIKIMKKKYEDMTYWNLISNKTKKAMKKKNIRNKVLKHIAILAKNKKGHIKSEKSKVRHHINLNRRDNKDLNILILPNMNKHRQLHARAYDYLVKINQITEYIKWFKKIYL